MQISCQLNSVRPGTNLACKPRLERLGLAHWLLSSLPFAMRSFSNKLFRIECKKADCHTHTHTHTHTLVKKRHFDPKAAFTPVAGSNDFIPLYPATDGQQTRQQFCRRQFSNMLTATGHMLPATCCPGVNAA